MLSRTRLHTFRQKIPSSWYILILALLIPLITGFTLGGFLISIALISFLALSIIDFHYRIAPDFLNLIAFSSAVGSHFFNETMPIAIQHAIYALAGIGAMAIARMIFVMITDKEEIGEGDLLIAGTVTAILGPEAALAAMGVTGIIVLAWIAFIEAEKETVPAIPPLFLITFMFFLYGASSNS